MISIAAPAFELWRRDGRSARWAPPRGAIERHVSQLPALVQFDGPTRGTTGNVRTRLDQAFDAVVAIEGGRALLSLGDVHRLGRGAPVTWRSRSPAAGEVMARALRAEGWEAGGPAGPAGTWIRGEARAELTVAEDGPWYVVTVRPVD